MANSLQIGIWGGPNSGKSTFLAAMEIAALTDETGEWTIRGQDSLFPGSTAFLDDQTKLLQNRRIPEQGSTSSGDFGYRVSGNLNWHLLRHLNSMFGERKGWRTLPSLRRLFKPLNFLLHVRDYPGGVFVSSELQDPLWAYLADCQGLVYLFDPSLEETPDGNFASLGRATDYLSQMLQENNKLISDRLPHYVAICISKFDEPSTFQRLRTAGLISQNGPSRVGAPHVTDPEAAFHLLTQYSSQSSQDLITPLLKRSFLPERVAYFAVSSIGFYVGAGGRVDLDDCVNIIDTPAAQLLRGAAMPINVFTPLIWIQSQILRGG